MRIAVLVLSLCMISTLAFAEDTLPAPDITVQLTAQEQAAWGQVKSFMDVCIASTALRGDTLTCRDLAAFLSNEAAKIAAGKPIVAATSPGK